MIVLLIAVLPLMGLADANCAPASCFEKTSKYQTFQDFIPRQDEISQVSFCHNVNEALSCVNDSEEVEECPEDGNPQSLVIAAMRSLCQDSETAGGGGILGGLSFSPCTGGEFQLQFAMAMQKCQRIFAIDFMTSECPTTYRGRMCLFRNMRKMCGVDFAKYASDIWGALEALNCYYQRKVFAQLGGYMGSFIPSFAMQVPMFGGFGSEK